MLHAITQKKTRFYRRYLGQRVKNEGRVNEEDEITSLIMSPLSFLPNIAIVLFWKKIIEFDGKNQLPDKVTAVTHAAMKFWPHRQHTRVEPDMLVELHFDQGKKYFLLVEFKWHAPLSGPCQLHKQWNEFLKEEERNNAYHIFIAPDVTAGRQAISDANQWNGRMLLRSWYQILIVMDNLIESKNSDGEILKPWLQQVIRVLNMLNIRHFCGFDQFKNRTCPDSQLNRVFWKGFSGFMRLNPPDIPIVNSPLFILRGSHG